MATTSKVSIHINRTPEKVWEALMNPDNLRHWLTGFISAEPVSGKPGEQGSISRLRFSERGKEIEVTETVVNIKSNQQYTFNMTSTAFDANTDIRLISFGGHTEMIQTVEFFPKQFLMKLLMPLMKGAMKKRMGNELIRFKNFVETKS